jgi:hypothetical protein
MAYYLIRVIIISQILSTCIISATNRRTKNKRTAPIIICLFPYDKYVAMLELEVYHKVPSASSQLYYGHSANQATMLDACIIERLLCKFNYTPTSLRHPLYLFMVLHQLSIHTAIKPVICAIK